MLADKGAKIGGTRKGEDEEAEENELLGKPMCDYSRTLESLEAIEKVSAGMPLLCKNVFLLHIFSDTINRAVKRYRKDDIGYDGLFDIFGKAFKSYTASELADFMAMPNN